jgi:hypothetical protein
VARVQECTHEPNTFLTSNPLLILMSSAPFFLFVIKGCCQFIETRSRSRTVPLHRSDDFVRIPRTYREGRCARAPICPRALFVATPSPGGPEIDFEVDLISNVQGYCERADNRRSRHHPSWHPRAVRAASPRVDHGPSHCYRRHTCAPLLYCETVRLVLSSCRIAPYVVVLTVGRPHIHAGCQIPLLISWTKRAPLQGLLRT